MPLVFCKARLTSLSKPTLLKPASNHLHETSDQPNESVVTSGATSAVTSGVKGHRQKAKGDMLKTNFPIYIVTDKIKWAVSEQKQPYGAVTRYIF